MKIVNKIMVANFVNILLIALTGFLAYRSQDQVLTKLRFMEIADDLNSSFLEMRLAEKNYFLYGDRSVLPEIEKKINAVFYAIEDSRPNIVRAIGEGKTGQLESSLANYRQALNEAEVGDMTVQTSVREAGQKLGEFTKYVTVTERAEVNQIIAGSRRGLFFSLAFILLTAVGITHLTSFRILSSLKRIEKATHLISEGDFSKIEPSTSRDECGLAISALVSMAQELRNREEQVLHYPLNALGFLLDCFHVFDMLVPVQVIVEVDEVLRHHRDIIERVSDLVGHASDKYPD
jgi:two-component system NtrC family sensor kinase